MNKNDEALFEILIEFGMCFVMKHEANVDCSKLTKKFIIEINELFNKNKSEAVLDEGEIEKRLRTWVEKKDAKLGYLVATTLKAYEIKQLAHEIAQTGIEKLRKMLPKEYSKKQIKEMNRDGAYALTHAYLNGRKDCINEMKESIAQAGIEKLGKE